MEKLRLPDESGISWLVYQSDDDPIWLALKEARSQHFDLATLVLPDELPRLLQVHAPRWSDVAALWRDTEDIADTRLRQAVAVNQLRTVMQQAYVDKQRSGGL